MSLRGKQTEATSTDKAEGEPKSQRTTHGPVPSREEAEPAASPPHLTAPKEAAQARHTRESTADAARTAPGQG